LSGAECPVKRHPKLSQRLIWSLVSKGADTGPAQRQSNC
jgi:hypothetical protein